MLWCEDWSGRTHQAPAASGVSGVPGLCNVGGHGVAGAGRSVVP